VVAAVTAALVVGPLRSQDAEVHDILKINDVAALRCPLPSRLDNQVARSKGVTMRKSGASVHGVRVGLRLMAASLVVGIATVSVTTIAASVAAAIPIVSQCPAPVITGGTAVATCSYDGTTGADGTDQTWIVPPGVTQATFDVYGAQGGDDFGSGGDGGETTALLSVTPGTSFSVVVAGQGGGVGGCTGQTAAGGFGGGGPGGSTACPGGAGGGASSVSEGASVLLVAGGGGGAANICTGSSCADGGDGGGLSGTAGSAAGDPGAGGAPGNQSGGGVATGDATGGGPGQGGTGSPGTGPCVFPTDGGGGGGGGYFGGAGGDGCTGGGGGSGYAAPGLSPTFNTGVRSGNGVVTITYVPSCAAGLTPHVVNATSATGAFVGLFCVNAQGNGTYTQTGGAHGTGTLAVVGTTTRIKAWGTNLELTGVVQGTKGTFTEIAPAPRKTGTVTFG
jgi:hypothetical protein